MVSFHNHEKVTFSLTNFSEWILSLSWQKVIDMVSFDATEPVVILGFGQMGQVITHVAKWFLK